jgi:AmiR/NasT family two-component response regulator
MDRSTGATEGDEVQTPVARFLRSARLCRARDLKQLLVFSELVRRMGELIHALQKERGASSIFLGSNGVQFADRLAARIVDCRECEQVARAGLEHVGKKLDRMSSGARFYTRVALAFRALDALADTREQIASLTMVPQDAVKAFTDIIGCLLAVVFEVTDIAADPTISRALVALVNFAQGKEYAGQERATAGAAFSRGHFHASEHRRLQHLVIAQEQSFRIFAEFADPAQTTAFQGILTGPESAEVKLMRKVAFVGGPLGELAGVTADAWFEQTTRRIDAMKAIEDQLAADLKRLCADKLAEARDERERIDVDSPRAVAATSSVAMLVTDVDPALNNLGLDGGVGLYTLDSSQPTAMRSILDVIQAQSRRIEDVSNQLQSARLALTERNVIERAKGLLMKSRRLSEKEAYALMRESAMNQNRRIFEVAEAILSTAEILKA